MPLTYLALTLALLPALPTAAQEKGQIGIDLSVGFSSAPQTLGLTYHVTKRFAVRPLFSFEHDSSDSVASFFAAPDGSVDATTTTTTDSFAAGIEALLYIARSEGFSTYIGASYERSHSSFEGWRRSSRARSANSLHPWPGWSQSQTTGRP
jgi:hypothetical protein